MRRYDVDRLIGEGDQPVPVTTSTDNAVRLLTIKEAAEILRIPISWLYERTRRNAIPYRRIGKYVRFTQDDLKEIISSGEQSRKQISGGV
jgi:excisionase family DNA binding protein